MKKLITESELKARVSRLKEYMSVVESEQVNEVNWGALGTGAMNAARTAGGAIKNALGTTGGKVAAGAAAGAGALAAGQALTKPGQAPAAPAGQGGKPAAPAGAPKVAYDKTMPAATVQELQTKLNAKDPTLKLTVDGKLGPATKAAMAKYPDVTTDPNAPQNQAAAPEAPAAAPAAPAAPADPTQPANPLAGAKAAAPTGMQAQGDDAGNTTITRPDGSTMVVGPDGKQVMPGSNPNLPQNQGFLNTAKNMVKGTGDYQNPTGFIPPADPTQPANPLAGAKAAPAAAKPIFTKNDGTNAEPPGFVRPPPGVILDPAAAPAADWESSPVAASKLTPQEKALAQKSGMATTPAQLAALAKQNMAAAQAGQPISATPTNESVGYQSDELNRIISLVHHR